jgi:tRNA dimethylallyltransferase
MDDRPLLALVGPTASGKSEAAIQIAEAVSAEIVSVDSMLLYRGMDVGTAKPSPEDRARVPHHLIDVAEPSEPFSVARYQALASDVVERVRGRGARVLLAGGSGLYFRAIVDRLEFPGTDPAIRRELEIAAAVLGPRPLYERLQRFDPDAAGKIELHNVRRTVRALEVAATTGRPFSSFAQAWRSYPTGDLRAAGVEPTREALEARIHARVAAMLRAGFLDEVAALLERGLFGWLTSSQAIGYAEFARHLRADLSLDEAIERTVKRTRALARRQLAWFRRDPRIRWFQTDERGASAIAEPLTRYLRDG